MTGQKYPADLSIFPLEGGCACGLVRYSITAPPLVVNCCHCTSCQRETGTAFALNAFVPASDLQIQVPSTPATIPLSEAAAAAANGSSSATAKKALPDVGGIIASGATPLMPERVLTPTESGMGQLAARCPRCRVRIYCEYGTAGPALKVVCVGTLDKAWAVEPDVHIFTASKRSFVSLNDGKPQFEGVADREAVWRPESLERWRTSLLPKIKAHLKAVRMENKL